jgi:hypothetical protein
MLGKEAPPSAVIFFRRTSPSDNEFEVISETDNVLNTILGLSKNTDASKDRFSTWKLDTLMLLDFTSSNVQVLQEILSNMHSVPLLRSTNESAHESCRVLLLPVLQMLKEAETPIISDTSSILPVSKIP